MRGPVEVYLFSFGLRNGLTELPSADMNQEWLSAHIHFRGSLYGPACDRVILDVVEPFVRTCQQREWASQYFFIRYSEDGPHVRLRLQGDNSVLRSTVRPALKEHVRGTLPEALNPESEATSNGNSSSIRWIPYERETNRYGGEAGVVLAERIFQHSSEISFMLLRDTRDRRHAARLGKGLLAMVVLLYAFLPDRMQAEELMQNYGTSYLSSIARSDEQQALLQQAFEEGYERQDDTLAAYVNETWKRLEEGAPLTDVLDTYRRHLQEITEEFRRFLQEGRLVKNDVVLERWAQAVSMIVPSYVHMTNNRLGIPIPEEAYLAHLITKTLSASAEPASS